MMGTPTKLLSTEGTSLLFTEKMEEKVPVSV